MLVGNKTKNYDFQSKVFLEKENWLILTRCWNHIFQRNFSEKKSIRSSRWRFWAFRILLRRPLHFLVNKKRFLTKICFLMNFSIWHFLRNVASIELVFLANLIAIQYQLIHFPSSNFIYKMNVLPGSFENDTINIGNTNKF